MSTASVIRPLAPSEQMFAFGEVFVGYSTRVSGRLDLSALSTAFDAVVRAYPILGARLEATGTGGHVLVASPGAAPEISVVDGDPEQLLAGAKFDQSVAVGALCVVRDGDTASVTLVIHHSVADAYHSLAILGDLWSFYRAAAEGGPLVAEVHPYPDPVEVLLAARGIEKFPTPAAAAPAPQSAAIPAAPAPDDIAPGYPMPQTTRCRLSEEATARLVDLGHREQVTMHGLVSAAILLMEAEVRALPLTELMYLYSVDLRARVSPPIGLTDGTDVLGFANYVPSAEAGTTLIGLARGVCDTLRGAVASGFVQQTPLQIPDVAAAGPPKIPGMVVATNWGRVPQLPSQKDLRIDDFRSIFIAKPDRTGRRPAANTCVISTYDGRLSIEIHHQPQTAEQEQRRIELLTATLHSAVETRSPQ
ncbi:phthiocerol/phthiodiolone dimycocerosyl transferase family protein [Nocardia bhagyanarayanae]|uniref:Phthiocerol/phthiodiolone dimycocerosyl transferase n=1 Tax=Nocardia bhagyanarayanae TaxID=1215925 RepID=A0A543FIG5_9NOCA|nr:acyltransferase [Nocardia bhagyanarayanae]TQM33552.1 acetyltransferase [Nocardia bhagyanarayanae]